MSNDEVADLHVYTFSLGFVFDGVLRRLQRYQVFNNERWPNPGQSQILDKYTLSTNMARDLQLGNPRLQGSLVPANSIQLRHELHIFESQRGRTQNDQ